MQTLKNAAAPVLLVVIWMIASVHTISQLTTVVPALHGVESASAGRRQPLRVIAQARSAQRRVP